MVDPPQQPGRIRNVATARDHIRNCYRKPAWKRAASRIHGGGKLKGEGLTAVLGPRTRAHRPSLGNAHIMRANEAGASAGCSAIPQKCTTHASFCQRILDEMVQGRLETLDDFSFVIELATGCRDAGFRV